jgi:hypothetical protein
VWDEVMQLTIVFIFNAYIHTNLIQKLPQNSVLKKRIMLSIRTGFSKALRVDFSSHISVGIDFAMCCITGGVQSYDDYQDGKISNAEEKGDMSMNQCQTTEVHAASKIVIHALTQIALAVTLTGIF